MQKKKNMLENEDDAEEPEEDEIEQEKEGSIQAEDEDSYCSAPSYNS